MPEFNNVTYREPDSFEVFGPDTQTKFNIWRYPRDIGNADRGHYVAFFIRGDVSAPPSPAIQKFNPNGDVSQSLSQLGVKNYITYGGGKTFLGTFRPSLTNQAIVLYMPDTLNFDLKQSYSNLTPGKEFLAQAIMAGPSILGYLKKGDFKGMALAALNSGAGTIALKSVANQLGLSSDASLDKILSAFKGGQVLNPMLELMYGSPDLRTFQFEFFFHPRDEMESKHVLDIIELFKYHSSPELGSTGMLIPPSQFDISFFYRGKQNPNIPEIATCVLTGVQSNYAPKGFATYESFSDPDTPTKGGTGMPVSITLSLSFTETTYLTKADFGFGKQDAAASAIPNADDSSKPIASDGPYTGLGLAGNQKGSSKKKRVTKNKKPQVNAVPLVTAQNFAPGGNRAFASDQPTKNKEKSFAERYSLRNYNKFS